MPLLKIIRNQHNQIGLWALEENPAELEKMLILSEQDRIQLEKFTSLFRKREFLAVRIVLTKLLGSYPEVIYDQRHRPFLAGRNINISISHSRSLVAVIISERPAGIDAEELHRDITPIVGRFMNTREIAWSTLHPDPDKVRILCWSVKESVFKLMGVENIEFRSMISIDPADTSEHGSVKVVVNPGEKQTILEVNYLFERNNVITWCELS
jgi:phosphopantetheinyl transferase